MIAFLAKSVTKIVGVQGDILSNHRDGIFLNVPGLRFYRPVGSVEDVLISEILCSSDRGQSSGVSNLICIWCQKTQEGLYGRVA